MTSNGKGRGKMEQPRPAYGDTPDRQHCRDCIHLEACADWVKAIWDEKYEEVMESEAENCANYTSAEFAKRYWGRRSIKDFLGEG